MDFLSLILVTVGASATTTGAVIVVLRWAGPMVSRLAGTMLKTRAELDKDRDRIITNLREEVSDLTRRLETTEVRAEKAEKEVEHLNLFIDTLLRRLGTTRRAIEAGEPFGRRA